MSKHQSPGEMEISFKGHRALVTGAGKGIGRATVKVLWALGAEVVALSRTAEDLDSLAQECPGVQTVCVDLMDWPATEAAMSSVGPVDLLVNNAGIAEEQSFLEMTQDSFDRHIAVHARAIIPVSQLLQNYNFHHVQTAFSYEDMLGVVVLQQLEGHEFDIPGLPHQIVARQIIARGGSGSIVNVSSQLSQSQLKNLGAYSTGKVAMDMLTKVMALELGPQKIRVNSVNPTVVMTRMGQKLFGKPEKATLLTSRIVLGRIAELDDVTNSIVFLLSDKSAMITGSRLNVEGGYLVS